MKKTILTVVILLTAICSFANADKYTEAMKKNIALIETSFKNPADLLKLADNFERIAVAEKDKWLPYYYAAFCQINVGYMQEDKDKIDPIADKATELINKADALNPKNSEISCVKSMIASCHMMVNPMQRWKDYGPVSSEAIADAMEQDPSNPRPYALKGEGLKYTPEQFGGGCKMAKPVLETALDKYKTFKPESEIAPNWGKDRIQKLFDECNK